jgi:hypothetical protein
MVNQGSRIATIGGEFGIMTKENSLIAIIGNTYQLVKRTMHFGQNLKEIKQVGNVSENKFRLEIAGNNIFFALSRPIFMAFTKAGLYRVVYDDVTKATALSSNELPKRRHIFAYFSSVEKVNYIYVQKVTKDEIENLEMYPESSANLLVEDKENPITIFYMNYSKEAMQASMIANSMTILISKHMYHNLYKNTSSIVISSNNENSRNITNIVILQNQDMSLSVKIDNDVYEIPDDVQYFNNKDLSDFHIIVTISYDIMTIVVFSRNSLTKQNACSMVRYHLDKRLYIAKDLLKQTLQQRGLMPQDHLSDVLNYTTIPNFAHLSMKLGYPFENA